MIKIVIRLFILFMTTYVLSYFLNRKMISTEPEKKSADEEDE